MVISGMTVTLEFNRVNDSGNVVAGFETGGELLIIVFVGAGIGASAVGKFTELPIA